jgi:polyisoprenoid-binding protein YceI
MVLRLCSIAFVLLSVVTTPADAAEQYVIDTKGQHAFIEFRIKHLGYSWLYGRFNEFAGAFTLDREALEHAGVEVEIDTASVDTNHAERDKHLRSSDFLHVDEHPTARFASTAVERTTDGAGVILGELTLKGVTNPVEIAFEEIGQGPDPWGGYRAGFIGTTTLRLADFGIDYDLGPASRTVELTLSVEGVRR